MCSDDDDDSVPNRSYRLIFNLITHDRGRCTLLI